MKMICTQQHEYGGRQVGVGETFDVEDRHVGVEIHLGRAKVVEAEITDVTQVPITYRTRAITRAPRNRRVQAQS
jgi:hypothetical protein